MNPEQRNVGEIPSWLLSSGADDVKKTGYSKSGFILRTMRNFSEILENEFYCEIYTSKEKLLQAVDPRVKIIVFAAFMIFSSFTGSLTVLAALAVIAAVYAGLSGLRLNDYLRRVWAYIPLIVFIFSLPGALNLFVKGKPVFYITGRGSPISAAGLYFTSAGLKNAFRLALRPGISLSFTFLILLTTSWTDIMGAFSSMRIPAAVTSILSMAYRYIFVLSQSAENMMEARFLRTVGRLGSSDNRRFVARSAAMLFVKSNFLSEEIYNAMVCRGFDGKTVSINGYGIRAADVIFIINSMLIFMILIAGVHLF